MVEKAENESFIETVFPELQIPNIHHLEGTAIVAFGVIDIPVVDVDPKIALWIKKNGKCPGPTGDIQDPVTRLHGELFSDGPVDGLEVVLEYPAGEQKQTRMIR
jgi:hypothetical protein